MSAQYFEFNQQRLRKDGVRLMRLAALGELALFVGLIATPWLLFQIQAPAMPSDDFLSFLRRAYLDDATAQPNLYGILKALLALAVLDRTRRLGTCLAGMDPFGRPTTINLRGLMWVMLVAILAMCFSVDVTHLAFKNTFEAQWDWSLTPFYVGVIVLLALSIVERIIRHANLLDAEVQEFV